MIYNTIFQINEKNKDKTAITIKLDDGGKREYTYEQIFEKSSLWSEKILSLGIKSGDRIIILGENSPEWNIAYLAIMKLECTAVLIDVSLSEEEISKLIEKADAKCIFTTESVINKFSSIKLVKMPILNIMNDAKFIEGSIEKLVENKEAFPGDKDVAVIIFSSGTTRSAAGIMHTHKALVETIKMMIEENNLTSDDRVFSILPNTHIYGVVTCLLGSMILGGSLYYIESISNVNVIGAFNDFKPTLFPGVPKVFELFEKQIKKKIDSNIATRYIYKVFFPLCFKLRKKFGINLGKIIFKSIHKGFGGEIKIMTSAGAPLEQGAAEFYYGTGFNLLGTYGLTETNIPLIGNRGKNITTDTCGKPYPGIEVKIANQDENGAGEIYIKTPYIMKGYFKDEESAKDAFEDGWFKTGDIAIKDKDGNIKIVGRSKENIVLATGKKVTPADIESNYLNISGVEELVVCGVPVRDADYEEVHGFIVKDKSNRPEEEILSDIKERAAELSLYMKMSKVHFVTDIPKTSLQKPKRFLLKKYALEGVKEISKTDEGEEDALDVKVKKIISKIAGIDYPLIKEESKIFTELGVDSLAIIEIASQIEEIWQVDIAEILTKDVTIGNIITFIQSPDKRENKLKRIIVKKKNILHYNIFKSISNLAHVLYKVKINDSHYIPEDSGYIICANHVSNIDYLWLTMKFKKEKFQNFCCMAKKELFNESFVSKLLVDTCGMIPVDRGGMNSEVIKCCKRQLKDKWGLLIHPEGTRSLNGELGELKNGAATIAKEAEVPIIPAYIKGAFEIFPAGTKMPKLFNWKKFKQYKVEVIYGEPIYPADFSVDEITKRVEQAIIALKNK